MLLQKLELEEVMMVEDASDVALEQAASGGQPGHCGSTAIVASFSFCSNC